MLYKSIESVLDACEYLNAKQIRAVQTFITSASRLVDSKAIDEIVVIVRPPVVARADYKLLAANYSCLFANLQIIIFQRDNR